MKEILPQSFVLEDTQGVQMNSLLFFMRVLGYKYNEDGYFLNDMKVNSARDRLRIHFSTAVSLHNGFIGVKGATTKISGRDYRAEYIMDSFGVSRETALVAEMCKSVDYIYLQYSKKQRKVLCHKFLVKGYY